MNAFLLRSKHLKNDLEEMVQYKLTRLLLYNTIVCEISCHYELAC